MRRPIFVEERRVHISWLYGEEEPHHAKWVEQFHEYVSIAANGRRLEVTLEGDLRPGDRQGSRDVDLSRLTDFVAVLTFKYVRTNQKKDHSGHFARLIHGEIYKKADGPVVWLAPLQPVAKLKPIIHEITLSDDCTRNHPWLHWVWQVMPKDGRLRVPEEKGYDSDIANAVSMILDLESSEARQAGAEDSQPRPPPARSLVQALLARLGLGGSTPTQAST